MEKRALIFIIIIIILVAGISAYFYYQSNFNKDDGDLSKKICEIGKEYDHNAVNPIDCQCPEGYEFETTEMGIGPCPQPGMTGCPDSVLKCVKG